MRLLETCMVGNAVFLTTVLFCRQTQKGDLKFVALELLDSALCLFVGYSSEADKGDAVARFIGLRFRKMFQPLKQLDFPRLPNHGGIQPFRLLHIQRERGGSRRQAKTESLHNSF